MPLWRITDAENTRTRQRGTDASRAEAAWPAGS
jgi:hypothetical protein